MTEHRLYDPSDPPDFFQNEWYDSREHAPHLEQGAHVERLMAAADQVGEMIARYKLSSVVDLGAGDGGLLQVLKRYHLPIWGYDLMKTNIEYAVNARMVDVQYKDFVNEPIIWAELSVITECLEHLPDPHAMVRRIGEHSNYIVASSPAHETPESHDACHAWCWDLEGYRALIEQGGFKVTSQIVTGGYGFQVITGEHG